MDVINWQPKPNKLFNSIVDVEQNNIFSIDFAKHLPMSSAILQPIIDSKVEWNNVPDFMKYIPNQILYGNNLIIFDSSAEAMCPIYEYKYWLTIEENCAKHNIDPKRVVYLSSNLLDKTNAKMKNIKFWVYNEIFWQNYCLKEWNLDTHVDRAFEDSVHRTTKTHTNKYFSSLNKNNQRPARSYLNYLLIEQGLNTCGLISQNIIPQDQQKYFDFNINTFNKELPLHIDEYSNTTGDNTHHRWIFDSTLFHIAQESSQSVDYKKTLISEKYFKPIANFTPFIVHGDPLINRMYTTAQGYKMYRSYFNISMGESWQDRAKTIARQVNEICKKLNQMTIAQRIDYKYQDETTLKHNYAVFLTNQFNIAQRQRFLADFKKYLATESN